MSKEVAMRYAQEKRRQKLHLVHTRDDEPELRAICGRRVRRWRITINLPMGMACRNCLRCLSVEAATP